VVTFPSATTSCFNTGFNLVESVAAAPPDWWNWAEAAAARLRASRRVPVSRGVPVVVQERGEGRGLGEKGLPFERGWWPTAEFQPGPGAFFCACGGSVGLGLVCGTGMALMCMLKRRCAGLHLCIVGVSPTSVRCRALPCDAVSCSCSARTSCCCAVLPAPA
jgi:hypothetical protein